jgi:hypothetical protein
MGRLRMAPGPGIVAVTRFDRGSYWDSERPLQATQELDGRSILSPVADQLPRGPCHVGQAEPAILALPDGGALPLTDDDGRAHAASPNRSSSLSPGAWRRRPARSLMRLSALGRPCPSSHRRSERQETPILRANAFTESPERCRAARIAAPDNVIRCQYREPR